MQSTTLVISCLWKLHWTHGQKGFELKFDEIKKGSNSDEI